MKSRISSLVIALIVAVLSTIISCSSKVEDKSKFSAASYDSMRLMFGSHKSFVAMLTERINAGDTSATKLKALLNTEYDLRRSTGLTDSEIEEMILAYRSSKRVIGTFDEISKTLGNIEPNTDRKKVDSILHSLEEQVKKTKEQMMTSPQ